MALAPLVLLAALHASIDPAAPTCPVELFRIARSTNANVVVYEANLSAPGRLDPGDPVHASWLLAGNRGRREALSFLERSLAYGFDLRPASPLPGFWLTLKAEQDWHIRVTEIRGCPAAVADIAGRPAVLRRIDVKTAGPDLFPKVEWVELSGRALDGGDELRERIVPSGPDPTSAEAFDRPWNG